MVRLVELQKIPPLRINDVELEMWKKVYVYVNIPVDDELDYSEDYSLISLNLEFLTRKYGEHIPDYVVQCSDGVTVCVSSIELFTKILRRYQTNTREEKNRIAKTILNNHVKKLMNEKKILPGKE